MPVCRWLPVPLLASLEGQECRLVGGGGLEDGVHDSLSCTASPVSDTHHSRVVLPFVHQGEGLGGRDPGSSDEGSYRACNSPTRLLQPYVCGPQGHRRLETNYRPLGPQPLCSEDKIPYGDHSVGPQVNKEGRLDDLHRSKGCLLADSDSLSQSQVSQICSWGRGMAIQGAMLRPHHGSSGLHSGDGSGFGDSPSIGDSNSSLFRRLADFGNIQGGSHAGKGCSNSIMSRIRDSSQLRQIESDSLSEVSISGDGDRFGSFHGFSDSPEDPEILKDSRRISVLKSSASNILEGSLRSPGIPHVASPRGTSQDEVSSISSFSQLGFSGRVSLGRLGRGLSKGPPLVVRRRSSVGRSLIGDRHTRPNVLVRRIRRGLGSQSDGPVHLWRLVGRGGPSLYQRSRVVGSGEGSPCFSGFSDSPSSCSVLRQHHSGVLPQEARRDSLPPAQFSSSENSPVGRGEGDSSSPSVCDGVPQRHFGLSFQEESGSGFGMDSSHGCVRGIEKEVACEHRSFCNFVKSPLFCIFCSGIGSHVGGHGCHAPVMGPYPGVCLPSFSNCQAGDKQDQVFQGDSDHVDSTPLEAKRMVSRSTGTIAGTSRETATQTGSFKSATLSQISLKPVYAKPSCLETLERFAKAAGFSSRVARQLARSRRKSSLESYQSRWSIFRAWCSSKGHSVSHPSVPKIAEFLLWLWQVKKLSLPSIKVYRSMLSAIFKFKIPSLSQDPFLRDLIRSFAVQKPRSPQTFPTWDLNKVLKFLMSSSFEPLEQMDLRTMSMKVLFLVALATAKRVGELQALSAIVPSQGRDLVLTYLSSFVAKTESVTNPLPRSCVLKSLVDFAGDLDEGSLLCPVRALKIYLEKTKTLSPRPKSLFVSPRRPSFAISKNAISYFLRKVIVDAGALVDKEGPSPRAHSIRGVATSAAFLKNFSIVKVLEAASWRSNSVFSLFYFKDITYSLDNCKSLGPFVAAGAIVD